PVNCARFFKKSLRFVIIRFHRILLVCKIDCVIIQPDTKYLSRGERKYIKNYEASIALLI
ncbi:hypothetical protein, partial [Helicobacter typhlonius]|uniref:hypothetical protein n=1 Tax=Helicobacter typhlonius TaxID=76936 RepID=UPI001F3BCE11